jgi:hypothetical protein
VENTGEDKSYYYNNAVEYFIIFCVPESSLWARNLDQNDCIDFLLEGAKHFLFVAQGNLA